MRGDDCGDRDSLRLEDPSSYSFVSLKAWNTNWSVGAGDHSCLRQSCNHSRIQGQRELKKEDWQPPCVLCTMEDTVALAGPHLPSWPSGPRGDSLLGKNIAILLQCQPSP